MGTCNHLFLHCDCVKNNFTFYFNFPVYLNMLSSFYRGWILSHKLVRNFFVLVIGNIGMVVLSNVLHLLWSHLSYLIVYAGCPHILHDECSSHHTTILALRSRIFASSKLFTYTYHLTSALAYVYRTKQAWHNWHWMLTNIYLPIDLPTKYGRLSIKFFSIYQIPV